MTEQEKLERRIVLAEAMGFYDFCQSPITGEWLALPEGQTRPSNGRTSHHKLLPDFDKDASARERLLEWALMEFPAFYIGRNRINGQWWFCVEEQTYFGDTYAEALTGAIYAAVKARQS